MARHYVAGETLEQAMAVVAALNAEGTLATVDVLGESVTKLEQAQATVEAYTQLQQAIADRGL